MINLLAWLATVVFVAFGNYGFAEQKLAKLYVSPTGASQQIKDLKWERPELETEIRATRLGARRVALLKGRYTRVNWNIINILEKIKVKEDGAFTFEFPLTGERTVLEIFAIGPLGQVEKSIMVIVFQDWAKDKSEIKALSHARSKFVPAVGFSGLFYKQRQKPDYSALAVTAKVSYQTYIYFPRIDVGISSYLTLVPLMSNSSNGAAVRYFGANLRVGYVLPWIDTPWRVSVMGGGYYTTMFVTGNAFGYTNVWGPQVYPVVERKFGNGDQVFSYFKYSPVSAGGLSFLTLANRELAFGGGWTHPLKNSHAISALLDVAHLGLNSSSGQRIVDATSVTLSFGYGW